MCQIESKASLLQHMWSKKRKEKAGFKPNDSISALDV